jgi:hypothetical protein
MSQITTALIFFFAPIGFCGSIMFACFAVAHFLDRK